MKHIATVLVLVALFALGIVPQARAGENEACSNATLRGSFGYTSVGTIVSLPGALAGPFAEVGRETFDGNGKTHATATLSDDGNTLTATIDGTYVVNPDCTGSMTLNVTFPDGFGTALVHADFVIDEGGAELRAIVTDSGVVESRVYKKQFPAKEQQKQL
jgi:hypothetical protein